MSDLITKEKWDKLNLDEKVIYTEKISEETAIEVKEMLAKGQELINELLTPLPDFSKDFYHKGTNISKGHGLIKRELQPGEPKISCYVTKVVKDE